MCGRFTQSFTWAEVCDFYRLIDEILPNLEPSWNIAPAQAARVILRDDDGLHLLPMRFGLVPFWAKDVSIGAKLINARAETVAEKPAFRRALAMRRCVIPASGFYEWQRQGQAKQPWYVTGAEAGPLTFAGLWEMWDSLLSFTIITVDANEAVAPVHNRMPALLTRNDADAWLRTGALSLLKPWTGDLRMWPVSSRVNSPANNDPGLIEHSAETLFTLMEAPAARPLVDE
jgi:putative SOS response-associated peptidase YedK